VAPIPGKPVIGIEVPNVDRQAVRLKEILASEAFERSKSKLTLALGKDILGNPFTTDLVKMPHLLIAGATGAGKSVGLNAMICSVLYKATPEEVKLLLIDPKRIELSAYEDIPHLIVPVVTEAKKATRALHWAVEEMERRYTLMAEKGVRNLHQYNRKVVKEKEAAEHAAKSGDSETLSEEDRSDEKLPIVLIVIDELADLMLVASRDVEVALTRLAQMARAAGIHLLIATQRPSVDVLTGIIKANFPTRISFQVSSRTDSRTILDANGAENLLGNGDMLLLPPGTAKLQRIHGAYVSEGEIRRIIDFLKKQRKPIYQEEILQIRPGEEEKGREDEYDEKYDEAVALVTETRQASISMIQRRLRVGYNRAARMIEMMERDGVVSPSEGSKPREVLVRGYNE
jgi:S-DNA-T family DNA segregation ATPase FtsK/SpoIIIE